MGGGRGRGYTTCYTNRRLYSLLAHSRIRFAHLLRSPASPVKSYGCRPRGFLVYHRLCSGYAVGMVWVWCGYDVGMMWVCSGSGLGLV